MELVVSVFDENPRGFFENLKKCRSTFTSAHFYVHSEGFRSHFTTGTKGYKKVNQTWYFPPFGKSYKIPNAGDEALAYVSYVVDRYNTLPPKVSFVHAHINSWHSGNLCDYLRKASVSEKKFEFFNKKDASVYCNELNKNSTGWAKRSFHNWYRWFDEAPPKFIHYKCCAQFAVTRELIRRHSLNTWKKIHTKALAHRDGAHDEEKLRFENLWRPILDDSDANTPCSKKLYKK